MGNHYLEIMSDKKIAIVDCNNFYVSCERLFNPKLKTAPTVVLSNNDGCVIARSSEVKSMGVKMGQPVFKLDKDIKDSVVKFSSNYVLYGDISDRISTILGTFTPELEIYSIDESFLDLTHVEDGDLESYCQTIREEVLRLTGIPVSIGVAKNKTLAKLANALAKSNPQFSGVVSLISNQIDISDIEIGEVWGIGRRWEKKLRGFGIFSIGQFKELKSWQVKSMLTIVGLRTWQELHGELVYKIETSFKKPKVVTSSRSFGKTVWQKDQVYDAIWTFLEDACNKMKVEGVKTREVVIFVTTNPFEEGYFQFVKKCKLYLPSNEPQVIWNQVFEFLEDLPVKLWAKAGVVCGKLIGSEVMMENLFYKNWEHRERPQVLDKLWMTRRDFLSPNWTTDWDDIPKLS